MIGFYSEDQYFWSVMILHSGDLKGGGEEGMKKKEKENCRPSAALNSP